MQYGVVVDNECCKVHQVCLIGREVTRFGKLLLQSTVHLKKVIWGRDKWWSVAVLQADCVRSKIPNISAEKGKTYQTC